MDGSIVSGDRAIAQKALLERAARAASGFHAAGVGENDAVALVLRNDFAFFEAAMGAAVIGAYAVPVNWHLTADEAGYVIKDCAAKAIVIHADLLARIFDAIPDTAVVVVVPTPPEIRAAYGLDAAACDVPAGRMSWDDFVERHEPWTEAPKAARNNMIYTSGTTGRPKGVRREPATPDMQQAMGRMVSKIFDIRPSEVIRTVITGPVYHAAPNLYALFSV